VVRHPWLAAAAVLAAPAAGLAGPPADLTARIDARLTGAWAAAKVEPAGPADDATFLRRASLDLIGRVPTVAEVRAFLADPAPDRRARLVDRLLASPAHDRHMATVWRRAWLPQADAPAFARLADGFEDWVELRLRDRVPYDRIAREAITRVVEEGVGVSPAAFRTAAEHKPENLAANVSRAFLGVNLDCAQCHDHPFARWTRDQFWETAAFFARPTPLPGRNAALVVAVPGAGRTVGPRLLTDTPLAWPAAATSRDTGPELLAAWVTAADNPFFARNVANRVWAQLFGTGLVDPLDDLGGTEPPSHPELLDELAAGFAAGGFDLKALTRAVVLTRAYQLSSDAPAGRVPPPRAFARAAVRGLSGEQLYDSIRTAAGFPAGGDGLGGSRGSGERKRFAVQFQAEREALAERSVVQVLALMNGPVTAAAAGGPVLAAADAPFLDAGGRVEVLFLATLGRPPTTAEAAPLVAHVERAGTAGRRRALADAFWALVNTAEFGSNH
jgi:hypothetical protein